MRAASAFSAIFSLALLALAVAGCLFGNGYQVYLIAMVCLTAIVGVGLNVLLGLTGQVSLGHVGFFAIGAYAAAILTTFYGVSFWLALSVAVAVAGAVGVVINPAAYTHTSVAIFDAIHATTLPTVEVHITNIHAREPWRHTSYVSMAAKGMICGFGIAGYGLAIDGLAALLEQQSGAQR